MWFPWISWKLFRILRCWKSFLQNSHFFGNFDIKTQHVAFSTNTYKNKPQLEPFRAQIVKNALFAPKSLFGPKSAFWAQNAPLAKKWFWAKSAIWSKKCLLELSRTHIQVARIATWPPGSPKSGFCSQNHFFAPESHFALFALLDAKVNFLRKSALSRPHAADAYKTNGILMKMEPLLAQKRFWAKMYFGAQNRFSGSECEKWAKRALLGPKVHFSQKWPTS